MEAFELKNRLDDLDTDKDRVLFNMLNNLDGLYMLDSLEIFYGLKALGGLELLIFRHLSQGV